MSSWRKAMAYLGLVDELDEEYESASRRNARATSAPQPTVRLAADEPVPGQAEIDLREAAPRAVAAAATPAQTGAVGSGTAQAGGMQEAAPEPDNVRPLRPVGRRRPRGPETASHVPVVAVDQFDAVEAVAIRLRDREPVVMDVSSADKTTARRVVDFVSGAVFVSGARLQPLGNRAFLVLPDGVDVSSNERRRLGNLGYRVAVDQVGLA